MKLLKRLKEDFCGTCELRQLPKGTYFRILDKNGKFRKYKFEMSRNEKKSVLISIQPKWCEKICNEIAKDANGEPIYEKVIEVRKSKPNEVPCRVFIYQSKESKKRYINDRFLSLFNGKTSCSDMGKVIGEFICDEVDKIVPDCQFGYLDYLALCDTCLSIKEIQDYGKGKTLYGWHISDLKIYDKPRELYEFWLEDKCPYATIKGCTYRLHCLRAGENSHKNGRCGKLLQRPPQSWCYVEELQK